VSCSGFDDANPQLTTFRGQYAVRSVEAGVPIGADLLVATLAEPVTDLVGTLHAGLQLGLDWHGSPPTSAAGPSPAADVGGGASAD
jgi:hypothetical protein